MDALSMLFSLVAWQFFTLQVDLMTKFFPGVIYLEQVKSNLWRYWNEEGCCN